MGNIKRIILLLGLFLLALNVGNIKGDAGVKNDKGSLRIVGNVNENADPQFHDAKNDLKSMTGVDENSTTLENKSKELEIPTEVTKTHIEEAKKEDSGDQTSKVEKSKEPTKVEAEIKKLNFIENYKAETGTKEDANITVEKDVVNQIEKTVFPEQEEVQKESNADKEILIIDNDGITTVEEAERLKKIVEEKMHMSESEANDLINDLQSAGNENEMELQTSNLSFLQIAAFLSSIVMQLTLFPTVVKILRTKTTGELDGLPYVMLFYSSFLWLVYGMLIDNVGVVLPNFSGLLLGFLYTLAYHKNCKSMWLKQKLYSYYKICSSVTFLLYICIYFTTYDSYVFLVGLLSSLSSVINFGAPLSSLKAVIKNKDTSSIPLEMSIGSLICSFLWLLYGLLLKNLFLIIPNLGGFILGLMQVCLIMLYCNKPTPDFNADDTFFTEEKIVLNQESAFFPNPDTEYDIGVKEAPLNINDSFFQFSYDETSPLTSDFNYKNKYRAEHHMEFGT